MESPVDIDSFDQLFEAAPGSGGGGLGVAQLERIFGSIIRFVQGQGLAPDGDNWLVTIIAIFNAAGLLGVILISLYTILTVIFDTAADGKTFGQGTDTRYTIMRSVLGAVCFVPVAKGFTLAQIGLLWLMVNGSALADYAWTRVAELNIQGQNFVQQSKLYGTVDAAIAGQFSDALNALVIGNICANGLNNISAQINGTSGGMGPQRPPVQHVATHDIVVTNQHALDLGYGPVYGLRPQRERVVINRWQDNSGDYRHADNICGSVSFTQPITFSESGADIFDSIRVTAAQSLINNYRRAINGLQNEAAAIALRIEQGDGARQIQAMAISAVHAARARYISGVQEDLVDEGSPAYAEYQRSVEEVQQNALESIRHDGWLLAPSWQRGISLAVAEYRSTLGSLNIKSVAENNAARFLSHHSLDASWLGGRDANPIAESVMASMSEYQNKWATSAAVVAGAVRMNGAGATGMAGGADEIDGFINNLFAMLVDMFAVRDDGGYSDPMIDVTEYGYGLIGGGALVAAAAKISDWAPLVGAVTGGGVGAAAGAAVDQVGDVLLHPLGWGLLAAGFLTASVLPLLPLIYYYSAVVSWLILVVESMFALPLAVLTLFTPSRDGTLIGSWNRILLTIFGVFLRPIFTLTGFFFGMLLIAVALDYAYILFREMILMMQAQGSVLRIIGLLGIVIAFLVVSFYTVLVGSAMITQIGDGAMSAIGVAFSNAQGSMNIGQQTHDAMRVQRAIQPIPLGRLGGGDAPGRIGSGPASGGGPGGGAGGGVTFPNRGPVANIAALGLKGPGAVAGAAKGAVGSVAGAPRGQRLSTLGGEIKGRFNGPERGDKGGGKS